eukprot:1735460-Pleurochrysis_carterae.AAC.1
MPFRRRHVDLRRLRPRSRHLHPPRRQAALAVRSPASCASRDVSWALLGCSCVGCLERVSAKLVFVMPLVLRHRSVWSRLIEWLAGT